MDGARSPPSKPASSSSSNAPPTAFGYQTRLLERTSSRSGGGLLSRSNSQTTGSISASSGVAGLLSQPTGGSTRRWTPSHKVTHSLDTAKWEERIREAAGNGDESSRTTGSSRVASPTSSSGLASPTGSISRPDRRPSTPPPMRSSVSTDDSAVKGSDLQRTPKYLKRQTMPAPIIASPLSPNTTGISVENSNSPSTSFASTSNRIFLPSSAAFPSSSSSALSNKDLPALPSPTPSPSSSRVGVVRGPSVRSRAQTLDAVATGDASQFASSSRTRDLPKPINSPFLASSEASTPASPSRPTREFPKPLNSPSRRPTSHYGSLYGSSTPDLTVTRPSPGPSTSTFAERDTAPPLPSEILPAEASSVMSPPPYRSSYMANRNNKASTYGDHLVVGGRKLGRHLPRIASGDGDEERDQVIEQQSRESKRAARLRGREEGGGRGEVQFAVPLRSPPPGDVPVTAAVPPGAAAVTGVPGRVRLNRHTAPLPASPLPSARLTRGLWADTQRHLIQAYEYLCHVGEAQQWIEGCLGEELEFGVVELEDGLRNGVVLAKLVRVFRPGAVKKIYDAPKLDFRHSDNINHFFNFVREIGLPEGFIFELTDLYEKKNLPKVIYCIHALSHLLARRGMAQRIGNLLGALQFSDDQLQRTQKGLKDAGIAMPNFKNVGNELAREINEEPEPETEEERRDRLLEENESSILALQCVARGYLVRQHQAILRARMQLTERHLRQFQAHCFGALVRRRLHQLRRAQRDIVPWVVTLQAAARAMILRRRWHARLREIAHSARYVVKIQAQLRGVLQRRRFARLKAALRSSNVYVSKLQSAARARIARNSHNEMAKTFSRPAIQFSVVALQALARGVLARRAAMRRERMLRHHERSFVALQAHCRGVLIRRRVRNQLAKLEDVSHVVVRIQAAVRTYLARKRLLMLIRGLRKATPVVVGFQALARAKIATQQHHGVKKALAQAQTIVSVGGFQALARASIARNRHRELTRSLGFVAPDVVGTQAACRGALVRQDYYAWRDHLHRSEPIATLLQAMLRGAMQRKAFRTKMNYYKANLNKVVKIQSLVRAKETREQYRQLTMGSNVTLGTIKNFVHLLDDSEADFQDEVKVERLRKKVVEAIRENQTLESDLNDLDVRIGLNVQNFDGIVKARKRGVDRATAASLLAAHGDPFSGPNTMDQAAHRKLELYQQLFYLLQTRAEYLSSLFLQMSMDSAIEKNRRFTERVTLTIFGFGQDRREDFLLLKLFQTAIQDEINSAGSIHEIIHGHPVYVNIAVPYVRPKQSTYVRETLQSVIRRVIDAPSVGEPPIDLELDPSTIYRARIELEETHLGTASGKRKDLNFREALLDGPTRAVYIRALQTLRECTQWFLTALIQSTKRMPYNIRYLARETLLALRERYPDAPDTLLAACIGRLVYYRYINPAIVTPETFDIVPNTIDRHARKNLDQISKVLTQITTGSEFDDDSPKYVPINDFVRTAISQMTAWLLEVANVPDAETQFHAHEFLDATVSPKPIYISPNEIYTIHGLLMQHQNALAPRADDTLRTILTELGGVPHLGSDELKDARDAAITLELTNRFANVRDPRAEEKTLWVQAKRGVLAILRVQPDQDLEKALYRPVTEEDEEIWDEILEAEADHEQAQYAHNRRQPSTTGGDGAYRLDDIRSSNFSMVKARTIGFLLKLEQMGKITRQDKFQGILNAIAVDVRSKHRKRIQRQQEMESMNEALRQLLESKKQLEEKIKSYHSYVENTMQTMQRAGGKKRFVIPFTRQYYHLRDLQRAGDIPQFGSFLYTAKYLYEKGILLSIDQYSPRQFDKLHLTMSSNTAGVFTILLESALLGVSTRIASEDIKMEDLLQAKYEQRPYLSLFGGKAKMNFERFLYQINKKFYA
ncbi:ras GTPase-activating-like protein rng2 [Favolaschia claudopus]|uniref:Ras GTPase-activating-like protein rng2 n=1 Tax=Favolaschia claudopus TaxID=2862362 RepID=A0AAW0EBL5_9AGAR